MTAPATLDRINDFPGLVRYLREELEWEIPEEAAFDDLTFNWKPSEIGLDLDEPIEITQLRPLRADQRWGVFFLNFPHGKLPVTLMRRILRGLSKRKRASANAADQAAWDKDDLIFISAVGDADDRRLSFAHFQERGNDLPTLRVIGWDKDDTVRRLSHTDQVLRAKLGWLHGEGLPLSWRDAFTERPRESVRTAKEMAEALAALARDIRDRIKLILPKEKANGDLKQLFEAVKQTLSRDLDTEKFADTYAQTIAYGLLSARINQVRERDVKHEAAQRTGLGPKPALPAITADAAGQAMPTTNPFLKELFGSFLSAGGRDASGAGLDFDELGVGEVVDLLNAADMESVLLDFDKHKAGDDPVIHFYEGFLHAYDKALKVQRGVFYTPRPVVSFIVRSLDEVLRTEFGLADGLADVTTWDQFVATRSDYKVPAGVTGHEPFVKILDPATGTGTFLVEVIDLIHATMTKKWRSSGLDDTACIEAWNAYVPQHLLPRLYGFELMMAPYAVAHMKLGLKLADTGYRFEGIDAEGKPARARVFLTNALEPARDLGMELSFMSEALAHEAKAANEAKDKARFTVVVGNPPYSGVSFNMQPWAQGLVDRFRYIDGVALGERKSWLQNDYVKFLSFALGGIETSQVGVVGFITDNSYLDGPTFRGLRHQITTGFESAYLLDLGGKSTVLSTGQKDENVFEIQQGVAILLAVLASNDPRGVWVGTLRGTEEGKLTQLASHQLNDLVSQRGFPRREHYDFFDKLPTTLEADYAQFCPMSSVFGLCSVGVQTSRDHIAVGYSRAELIRNLNLFSDPRFSDEEVRETWFPPAKPDAKYPAGDTRGWRVAEVRPRLRQDKSWQDQIVPIAYRPFDIRQVVAAELVSDWPRPELRDAANVDGNVCLNLVRRTENQGPYHYFFVSEDLPSNHFVSLKDGSYGLPLWSPPTLGNPAAATNLDRRFITRLTVLTVLSFDDSSDASAQGALPGTEPPPPAQGVLALRRERGDLTTTFGARDVFDWIYAVLHSPAYRERHADFLKSDFARVPLPKDRALFAEMIPLGTELVALHLLDPVAAPILADPAVRLVNPNGVEARLDGRKADARRNAAGRVYVNDACWFETVPASVWDHWIGGYQPAQKWLKDRAAKGGKNKREGRALTPEDQLHYRRMIVAMGRTAELMVEIDKVIAGHGGWPDAFRGMKD